MIRIKRLFISVLIYILSASVLPVALNGFAISPVSPYPPQGMSLNVYYSEADGLTVDVEGGQQGYEYQYWIKTKVAVDNASNLANESYIWKMKKAFSESASETFALTDAERDNEGKYNVIVRIKSGGTIIDELLGVYSPALLGQPQIVLIEVGGRAYTGETVVLAETEISTMGSFPPDIEYNVKVSANLTGLEYYIYYGDCQTVLDSSGEGLFFVDFSVYGTGMHTLRIEAVNGANKDIKYLSIYIIEEYDEEGRLIINSFEGDTDQNTGKTVFTMELMHADGSIFETGDENLYEYTLNTGGRTIAASGVETDGDKLTVEFECDYNGYGIFETTATVTRAEQSGYDDKVIRYYDGYARYAVLNQTATAYTLQTGQSVTITADGFIDGVAENDLRYAFFREDASGWTMIKNYSCNPQITWTPTLSGTYIIQARIMDVYGKAYEKSALKTYTVTGIELEGGLELKIIDFYTGIATDNMDAGRPYKLFADYQSPQKEDILYKFTLESQNLGLTYLNKFNPCPYIIFIPPRADDYKITARIIKEENFGYKDLSVSRSIISAIALKLELTQSEYQIDIFNNDTFSIPEQNIITNGTLSYRAYFKGKEIPVTNNTIDTYQSGEYTVIVRAANIAGSFLEKSITLTAKDNIYDFEQNTDNVFDTDCATLKNRVSYEKKGIARLEGGGNYCMEFIPQSNYNVAAGEASGIAFAILPDGGQNLPQNTNISFNLNFDLNGEDLGEFDAYLAVGGRTKIMGFLGEESNSQICFGSPFGVWSPRIVCRLPYQGHEELPFELIIYHSTGDASNIRIYIDNIKTEKANLPKTEFNINFENISDICYFSSSKAPETAVNISRQAYNVIDISAPQGGGEYCLKYSPDLSFSVGVNSFADIYIDFGEILPIGCRINFKFYLECHMPANMAHQLRMYAPFVNWGHWCEFEDPVSFIYPDYKSYNQWDDMSWTLQENMQVVRLHMWYMIPIGYDATNNNMYIDNITVTYAVN